jgi:hypothetical protein
VFQLLSEVGVQYLSAAPARPVSSANAIRSRIAFSLCLSCFMVIPRLSQYSVFSVQSSESVNDNGDASGGRVELAVS